MHDRFEINDRDLEVEFIPEAGCPETLYDPGDPGGWLVEIVREDGVPVDVTDDEMDEIVAAINRRYGCENYCEAD
jgi:hypothetical protein